MTRKELADAIAEKTGTSKRWADDCVETVLDEIRAALVRGEDVTIRGFGVFKGVARAGRIARNIRTGEMIEVAPRRAVKFNPSKDLKDALNA